jgi:hypothetical protein
MKGELKMLKNGDRVSLIEGLLLFTFAITEEEDGEDSAIEDEFDQDATQPNVDFTSSLDAAGGEGGGGGMPSPLRAAGKRPRGTGVPSSPGRPNKKAKQLEDASLSSQDWDSQNSDNSVEMPGLRGTRRSSC